MPFLFTQTLLAAMSLPAAPSLVADTAGSTGNWLPVVATATVATAAMAINKKAFRKTLRKAMWQQLFHGKKSIDIENPAFFWVGGMLVAIGLMGGLLLGLWTLGVITIACGVLMLLRSLWD